MQTATTIRMISHDGSDWVVTTVGGMANAAGSVDGPGPSARFNQPGGVVVDGSGNLYVADTQNNTIRFGAPAATVGESFTLQISLDGKPVRRLLARVGCRRGFSPGNVPQPGGSRQLVGP